MLKLWKIFHIPFHSRTKKNKTSYLFISLISLTSHISFSTLSLPFYLKNYKTRKHKANKCYFPENMSFFKVTGFSAIIYSKHNYCSCQCNINPHFLTAPLKHSLSESLIILLTTFTRALNSKCSSECPSKWVLLFFSNRYCVCFFFFGRTSITTSSLILGNLHFMPFKWYILIQSVLSTALLCMYHFFLFHLEFAQFLNP